MSQTPLVRALLLSLLASATLLAGDDAALSPNLLTNSTFRQCTNPGIPDHWGVMNGLMGLPGVYRIPDWSADSYRTEPDSPIPGAHSLRAACRARIQSAAMGLSPKDVYTLSAYFRASSDDATAVLCIGDNMKTVRVSRRWQRCSFTGRVREYGHWRRSHLAVAFITKGPGTTWIAAPQLERTAARSAIRAIAWDSHVGMDYEIDESVAYTGRRSMRCRAGAGGDHDSSGGQQRVVLKKAIAGDIHVSGWCKTRDVAGKPPAVTVELYHPTGKTEAKPDQSASLCFSGRSHDWEHKTLRVSPKVVVKALVIKAENRSKNGTVWFDDLSVRPVGGAQEAEPTLDLDAGDEPAEDEEIGDDQGQNVLVNPGFEEAETRRVHSASSPPSDYQPSESDRFQALVRKAGAPPSLQCPTVSGKVAVDGILNEASWQKAAVPRLVSAADGGPAKTATECRLMRDDRQLYVALTCQSPGMRSDQDTDFASDNHVAVELKPDPTQKWFYRAAVDASGNKQGTCIIDKPFSLLTLALQRPKSRRWPWEQEWHAAVKAETDSWTAELAVPFASLRRTANRGRWALNLVRVRGEDQSSWSPTFRAAWKGGHWSSTFRASAERFRFGSLLGMANIAASAPSEGLYQITGLAFQHQPDDTLALLVEVTNRVPVPWTERKGTLEVELSGSGGQPAKMKAPVQLRRGTHTVKVAGLALKPVRGSYAVRAKLLDAETDCAFHNLNSWQSLVYGHRCDSGAGPPAMLFDHTYFPRLYELRAVTEFSYYTDEREARLLVESGLDEPLSLSVQAIPRGGGKAEGLAKVSLKPRQRQVCPLTISELAPATYDLKIIARDERGRPRTAARTELVKLLPNRVGARTNRFTGCLWVNGRPRIVHAAHIPVDERIISFMKSHRLNTVMMGLNVPEQGAEAAVTKLRQRLDDLHARGLGVIPWMRGTQADVVRTITSFRDHPAIAAWKVIDEPYCASKVLEELYAAAKGADPYRPAFVNWDHWYPGFGGRGSLLVSDIGSKDGYPFGATNWVVDLARPIGDMAQAFAVMGDDCAMLGKAGGFWQQIYGTDDAFREPTPAELRCLVVLGLIHRVRLTYYFTAIPMCVKLWDTIAEFGKMMEVFNQELASSEAFELERGQQGDVHFALWKTGAGRGCLLVANAAAAHVDFSVPVPALAGSGMLTAHSCGGDERAPIQRGRFRATLSPYQANLYFLR